jgi:hypothetical protein
MTGRNVRQRRCSGGGGRGEGNATEGREKYASWLMEGEARGA